MVSESPHHQEQAVPSTTPALDTSPISPPDSYPLAGPLRRLSDGRNRLWLLLLTLLAAGVRLFLLDAQSLWYDEGVTAEITRRTLVDLTRWTYSDIQPPLYYYVVALWGRLAGWSEWSLRFPSVFFGILLPPLLAALTYTVTRRRAAGLIAAMLAAFHPLLVYYSQEARMYAMLTLLTVALAYYVLSRRGSRLPTLGYWTGYVLLATAAVYTHYFAFFFIAALGVVFLVDLALFRHIPSTRGEPLTGHVPSSGTSSSGTRPSVWGRFLAFCAANLALLLLYVPWLTALFGQLSTDASYWEGEFKLDEAIRHVANRFTSGETMIEDQATLLLYGFAALSVPLLFVLLAGGVHARRTLLISLLWFFLPITGILGLALIVPKFNPRYAMIALPGLLLFWSAGLGLLLPTHASRLSTPRLLRLARTSVGAGAGGLLLLYVLGVFAYANYNWFADVNYTKAEWRELSAFIRGRIAAKQAAPATSSADSTTTADSTDLVVLVSGHAWPVWNYYAPDLPPLRLPDLEILDVNAILDFATTAQPLRTALQGKQDVWLVEWQEDIVDPMRIVPLQLEQAGTHQPLRNEFWHIDLAHYTQVNAEAVLVEPTGIADTSANFANQVYLLDHTVADNGDLLLFWQLHPDAPPTPPDLRITAELFTEQGLPFHRMVDRRPAGFEYPVFRWQANQITLGRIPADAWAGPGALPGNYRMRIGVYDIAGDLSGLDILGNQGQPLGKHAILDLALPVATPGESAPDRIAFAEIAADFWLEVALDAEQAEPGQAIPAELHWLADAPPPSPFALQLRWRVRDTEEVRGEQSINITPLPGPEWPTGQLLRTLHQWRPPLNLPPDDYWLEIGTTLPESSAIRVPMRILDSTRRYTPPAYATVVDRVFGEYLHLLGVIEPLDFQPRAAGQVALTLVWRAAELMPADYTVTVQWLGADNRPAAQADLSLPGGSSNWLSGQVELQSVFVDVPSAPGTYRLVAAVYNPNAPDLPRLLTREGEDLIQLAELTVIE